MARANMAGFVEAETSFDWLLGLERAASLELLLLLWVDLSGHACVSSLEIRIDRQSGWPWLDPLAPLLLLVPPPSPSWA